MRVQSIRIRAALFLLTIVACGICAAQQVPTKTKKKQSDSASGADLYKKNCSVCHGDDGKGNGPPPANSPFTETPPDLTTLALRHDGQFPEAYVTGVLQSGARVADHGPAEMPVWGTLFKAMTKSDEAQVKLRIANLTSYLKSIQAKPKP